MKKTLIVLVMISAMLLCGCMVRDEQSSALNSSGSESFSSILSGVKDNSNTKSNATVADKEVRKTFITNTLRLSKGEKIGDLEIQKMIHTIETSKNGINWNYINGLNSSSSKQEREAIRESELYFVYLPVSRENDVLNIADKYPKMSLQTVCDIINGSQNFEEITEKFALHDKIFGECNFISNTYYCSYYLDSDNEFTKEYIGIYPEAKLMFYCRVENNKPYGRWYDLSDSKLTDVYSSTQFLTPEHILNNLLPWNPES